MEASDFTKREVRITPGGGTFPVLFKHTPRDRLEIVIAGAKQSVSAACASSSGATPRRAAACRSRSA